MIENVDPKIIKHNAARCSECDREMTHYNEWLTPDGTKRVICWQCLARSEKGFFAKRDFRRGSRFGVIPR